MRNQQLVGVRMRANLQQCQCLLAVGDHAPCAIGKEIPRLARQTTETVLPLFGDQRLNIRRNLL
ncbi:hypothetical protein [Gemmatimonas sp.]|uniref:hypothetical protein n=1 Tax=Gemmatimonas sp. TaxID=1962908 RepID=UPI003DA41138